MSCHLHVDLLLFLIFSYLLTSTLSFELEYVSKWKTGLDQTKTYSSYERLDSSRKEIRVLRILPDPSARASSKSSGAIHCVLSHAFLEESPQYHALSYPWQDSTLNVSFDDPEANDSKVTIDGFILLNNQRVELPQAYGLLSGISDS